MAKKLEPIRYFKTDVTAIQPERMTEGSAGFDLTCCNDVVIKACALLTINVGLIVAIPEGYFGQIVGRSSLAKKRIYTHNGIIDSDYRGEICVLIENRSCEDIILKKNARIAQLILQKFEAPSFVEINRDALKALETTRGIGGFGSTN